MSVQERLQRAVEFATKVHEGQRYGDGPYIAHPLRVMEAVSDRAKVVAVLHDTVESGADETDYRPFVIMDEALALIAVTRVSSETYEGYVRSIAQRSGVAGEIAREVKIADLRDNLAHAPPESLRRRYEKALDILGGTRGEP